MTNLYMWKVLRAMRLIVCSRGEATEDGRRFVEGDEEMEQLSILWCVAAYAGVVIVGGLVQWMTRSRDADRREGAVAGLAVLVLAFSAAAFVLSFSLPSTPVLSSFGYPKTVSDLSPPYAC